jgi:hypothetical protein
MATTTKTHTAKTPTTPSFEGAYEQVKDFNEQFLDAARKAGTQYLDTYEKAVERTIELERKFAGATQQEWLKDLIETQIDLTREFNDAYAKAARGLLK